MTKVVQSKANETVTPASVTERKPLDWMGILQKTEMRALASISSEITQLIGDTNTSVSALAGMILKDAALTSQVLKIANSVVFSPERKPQVSSNQDSELRRAIVRIGFNGIRCICISVALIDSIVKKPAKQQRLLQCLAQSFHTAVHARNIAQEIPGCRCEDVFIAALLQNLGELVFWCSPIGDMDAFKAALEQANGEPEVAAELLTGLSFEEMSKQLAEAWSLSETLSDSFDATTLTKEVKAINLGKMMSSGMEAGGGSKQLHAALKKMTRDFKMDIQRGMSMLRAGADEAIAMANEYGPDVGKALLSCETLADDKPADEKQPDEASPAEAADKSEAGKNLDTNGLDTNVESLQLVDDIENPEVAKPKNKLQESMDEQSLRMPNGSRLLELVDEVWDLAEGSKPIANVCKRVADGVKEACGFERVAVFIKVNKKEEIKLAYLAGSLTEHWTKDLVLPINDKNDSIFRYGVRSNGPVWVTPDKISDVEKLITPPVKALIGEQQRFALSPIKSGLRVVAVVYADMAGETIEFSDVHFDAFSRFIKQAGRALSSI